MRWFLFYTLIGSLTLSLPVAAQTVQFDEFGMPTFQTEEAVVQDDAAAEAARDPATDEVVEEEMTEEERAALREEAMKILEGYGDIKWGASRADVEALLPDLRVVDNDRPQKEWLPRVVHYQSSGFAIIIERHFWFVEDQLWKMEHILDKRVLAQIGMDHAREVLNRKYYEDEETSAALQEATITVSMMPARENVVVIYKRDEIYDDAEHTALEVFNEKPANAAKELELERLL
ncbi:MAG: hypothetical protein ACKJSG_03800 [Lentisphaeria bacterium]